MTIYRADVGWTNALHECAFERKMQEAAALTFVLLQLFGLRYTQNTHIVQYHHGRAICLQWAQSTGTSCQRNESVTSLNKATAFWFWCVSTEATLATQMVAVQQYLCVYLFQHENRTRAYVRLCLEHLLMQSRNDHACWILQDDKFRGHDASQRNLLRRWWWSME